jgi:hypothetical protein
MANATVSLNTSTLLVTVEPSDNRIQLASTSGLAPGVRLFLDRELLAVETLTGIGTEAIVRRGVDGTTASRHATNTPVYIGRADQFYASDPVGLPPNELPVSPYINAVTGDIWVATGDESGPGLQGRLWSKVTRSMVPGALGGNAPVIVTPS